MVANATAVVRVCDQLINELCGETVKDVFQILASNGQQSLEGVVRLSKLPLVTVRSALLILLQHSFVSSQFVQPESTLKGTPAPYFIYTADTAAVLHILRWPWLLHHIAQEFRASAEDQDVDVLAFSVIQVLLEHGKLRTDQLLALVAVVQGGAAEHSEDDIKRCIATLVHTRYVQRARGCLTERPQRPLPANVKVRGAGSKSGTLEKALQEAHAARTLAEGDYQDARFSLPPGFLGGATGVVPVGGTKRRKVEKGARATNGPTTSGQGDTILWTINMEECNRRLRLALCIEHIEGAHGAQAGSLASALVRAGKRPGRADGNDEAKPMSGADTAAMLAKMRATDASLPAIKQDSAVRLLREMTEDASCPLESQGMAGLQDKLFVLDVRKGLEMLRQRHIEAIVRERFTIVGMRIFRMLLDKKQLEQKQIAEFAMVPVRDAREVLYKMLKAGFLALQDLPRTADHAANRTIFTWHIDMDAVRRRVATELLQAVGNLRSRMEHECLLRSELKKMVDLGVELSEHEKKEGKLLSIIGGVLQTRTLALDRLLALFDVA